MKDRGGRMEVKHEGWRTLNHIEMKVLIYHMPDFIILGFLFHFKGGLLGGKSRV